MTSIKINEQITFLRKQKGITQEELAQALGVTNQAVSKWEAGNNCPDILLLPMISDYFEVTVDELLGHKPAGSFGDVILKIKALVEETEQFHRIELAYKLAFMSIQGATMPPETGFSWETGKEKNFDHKDPDYFKYGSAQCSDFEGDTFVKQNTVFAASRRRYRPITKKEIGDLTLLLNRLRDKTVLNVMYAFYDLVVEALNSGNYDTPITSPMIAVKCGLSEVETEGALAQLPVEMCENGIGYRFTSSYVPSLLRMLV